MVVIQDATRELNSGAIRWALQGLSLKPGDKLTLLGVLRQTNYQTFSYKDSRNLCKFLNLLPSCVRNIVAR